MKRITILILFLFSANSFAQNSNFWKVSDTLNKQRRNFLIISETVAATGTLIALNEIWYADYPRRSFRFKNDNNDWLQMDKMGHVMTSYYVGKVGMDLLNWSGVCKKNQLIYGATAGFTFLTAVEVLDGFSTEWGFSWGDVASNALGTGILVGQELLWEEQRIKLKFSFSQSPYASQRPDVLGESFLEQTIKDYNGQTYWLSANLWSFNKDSNIPKWLNVAFGYGADGMLSANSNSVDFMNQNPYSQFYLSLDIDLERIETNSKFLKSVFSVINFIKIPAPTLEFTNENGFKFHFLHF